MTWSIGFSNAPRDGRKVPVGSLDGTVQMCHWMPSIGAWRYDGGYWPEAVRQPDGKWLGMAYSWYDLPSSPRKSKRPSV